MIVNEIAFVRAVPILGSHERKDRFYASEGWTIEVHDYGVTLSKPAEQNVPEVPAFCVCGVGYTVAAPVVLEPVALETDEGSAAGDSAVVAAMTFEEKAALAAKLGVPTLDGLSSETLRRASEGDSEVIDAVRGGRSLIPDAKGIAEGAGGGIGIISETTLNDATVNAEALLANAAGATHHRRGRRGPR